MIVLVKANVLAVGINGKHESLRKLPIRLVEMRNSAEAVRSLKSQNFDSVISTWDLPDSRDGKFIKSLRRAKPYLPVIAVTEANNIQQEIAARSIGASAVLSGDSNDEMFKRTVAQVLGLTDAEQIRQICAVADELDER